MDLLNLLAEEAESTAGSWMQWVPIIIIVVLLVAFFIWSFISQRKKQKNFNDTINAVRPGNKVKTIGGIVGEVVEVDDEENTFVLRTGGSDGNYSYMKFDKQAIYQTDAKPEPEQKDEAPAEKADEKPASDEQQPAEPFEGEKEGDKKDGE